MRSIRYVRVAVITVCAAAACSSPVERSLGTRQPATAPAVAPSGARDMEISEAAERNLQAKGLEGVRLEVRDGYVTLRGRVDTPEQRGLAEKTVKEMPGVVSVDNRIQVGREMMRAEEEYREIQRENVHRDKRVDVNVNKPGGPRRVGDVNVNKPGGPKKKP